MLGALNPLPILAVLLIARSALAAGEETSQGIRDREAKIASLTAELDAQRAETADQQRVLEGQNSQMSQLRVNELSEIAQALQQTQLMLLQENRDLRIAIGPTGTYFSNAIIDDLQARITSLEQQAADLRARYQALQTEQADAVQENALLRLQVARDGREREAVIRGGIAEAQAELDQMKAQEATPPAPGPSPVPG
jgi:hypothetical protein